MLGFFSRRTHLFFPRFLALGTLAYQYMLGLGQKLESVALRLLYRHIRQYRASSATVSRFTMVAFDHSHVLG